MNVGLRDAVVEDLMKAKNDVDILSTLCCGYYALYCEYTKATRDNLDICANNVRKDALKKAEELEREVADGYIIKE